MAVRRIPPPIPARTSNEPPILLTRQDDCKSSAETINKNESIERQSWQDNLKKLIDLDTSLSLSSNIDGKIYKKNNNNLQDIADNEFSRSNFTSDIEQFEGNHRDDTLKTNFDELQKAARDLEKRLHIGKNVINEPELLKNKTQLNSRY